MRTTVIQGRGVQLAAEGAAAPAWVQLFPAGPQIEARDGRAWTLDAAAVIAAFAADGAHKAIDLEHATQIKGEHGEAAPAVGWIVELAEREGAVWGRVEWLEDGADVVARRAYRYLSPAFTSSDGRIDRLISAGLTNTPALRLAALATEERRMKRVAKALGLPEDADEAAMEAAVAALKAREPAPATVDMAKFAPRGDLEQALARAETAERTLAERDAAARDAEIDAAIDAAAEAGKIAPASRDFYVEACRAEGGLEKFRTMIAGVAPVVTGARPAPTPSTGDHGLTPEEVEVARQMGVAPAEFAKSKEEAA